MNSEIISFISQSISTTVMNLLIFLFFNRIYQPKYKRTSLYVGSFIVSVVLMIFINQLNSPIINFIYTFVSVNLICILLFKTNFKKSWLYNALFLLIMFFCDTATVLIWSIIETEQIKLILHNYEMMCISNILNISIMYVSYRIFVSILSKNEIISIRMNESVFLLLMTSFEIFVAYNLSLLNINGTVFIIILIGFLIFNIYVTHIIWKISQNFKLKYELDLSKRQSELQLIHYKEMDQKYQESRKVIHDIKKHLSTLNILKDIDYKKAEEYGNLIDKKVSTLFRGFQCSNQILSIVMSQKIAVAESENIQVDTKIEDISFDFMDYLNITAIFANLWDNAIEACRKVNIEKRFIKFSTEKVNGFVIINVENCFNSNIVKKNNGILSTKENHDGVGISIIKSTVEKYGGLFTIKNEKSVFISEITIPIPIKREYKV